MKQTIERGDSLNGIEILKTFLNEVNIDESYLELIQNDIDNAYSYFSDLSDTDSFDISIVKGILIDTYAFNSTEVKLFSDVFIKKYGVLGREHKNLVKEYFDYNNSQTVYDLIDALNYSSIVLQYSELKAILDSYYVDHSQEAVDKFLFDWNVAVEKDDTKKQHDYLMGIFTSLLNIVDLSKVTLKEIYDYNQNYFNNTLSDNNLALLKKYCYSDKRDESISVQALKFCDFYNKLKQEENECRLLLGVQGEELKQIYFDNEAISKNNIFSFSKSALEYFSSESYSLVVLRLTQEIYNKFENTTAFFDYVIASIKSCYRVLENYKTFSVIIENIFDNNGTNLKWELYSIIGIYAEHFIPKKCTNNFYHPEKTCCEYLEYSGIDIPDLSESKIKKYYDGKVSIEELSSELGIETDILLTIGKIDELKYVWYGFTFQDCISLVGNNKKQNDEIDFISNNSDILLIFNKFRPDEYKIPCPDCGGLNISGNSYPEVGHRSWECKNIICPSRSKSNRGKRYSFRSNFMQFGSMNHSENNIISSEFIKKWHRDIVDIESSESTIEMLIKYFSFEGEQILFVNEDLEAIDICGNLKRNARIITDTNNGYNFDPVTDDFNGVYDEYFNNGSYVSRYLIEDEHQAIPNKSYNSAIAKSKALLIHGECRKILSEINDNTVDGAVTSPPYFNAREYSQWPNYYLYWSDIYRIIKECFRVMKPGTVFLFNIGDICGNENTVARSTMGNKRLLLGSYTIDLFKRAGFELLDNILWDKGEPQSNRQKNDGKFTPFYQKPLNCYEHMFIFKKPGAPLVKNEENTPNEWKKNIVKFSPVIKINSKGENKFGHTAPFPKDIPVFIAKTFTNSQDSIILDPFSGSLTSVIACIESGIRGVGIELCDEYVDLSRERALQEGINLSVIE